MKRLTVPELQKLHAVPSKEVPRLRSAAAQQLRLIGNQRGEPSARRRAAQIEGLTMAQQTPKEEASGNLPPQAAIL